MLEIETRFLGRPVYSKVTVPIELSRTEVKENGKNRIPAGLLGTLRLEISFGLTHILHLVSAITMFLYYT